MESEVRPAHRESRGTRGKTVPPGDGRMDILEGMGGADVLRGEGGGVDRYWMSPPAAEPSTGAT